MSVEVDYAAYYRRLLDEMTDVQKARVKVLRHEAIGYVWGWQDARGEKDTGVSLDFGYAYGAHAAEYALELFGWRMSPSAAWKCWQKVGRIERDFGDAKEEKN
jgi:hypothetical protein